MVEGLDARLRASPSDKPEDRDAWLRLANARRVLGDNDKAVEAYARADAIAALAPAQLVDWAEAHVRQIAPGAAVGPLCYVGENVQIGAGSCLLAQVTVGADSRIGADCLLHPGVRIGEGVRIGRGVRIHANACIGGETSESASCEGDCGSCGGCKH